MGRVAEDAKRGVRDGGGIPDAEGADGCERGLAWERGEHRAGDTRRWDGAGFDIFEDVDGGCGGGGRRRVDKGRDFERAGGRGGHSATESEVNLIPTIKISTEADVEEEEKEKAENGEANVDYEGEGEGEGRKW